MIPNTIILLVACFLALWATLKEASLRNNLQKWGNRDSFLMAAVLQGTLLVILTEGLSAFNLLERKYLISGWILVFIISLMVFIFLRISRIGFNRSLFNLNNWKLLGFQRSIATMVFIHIIGIQLLTLAFVAYSYPPNNWDSMTYHMARVMHWQQNQSVASYATINERQIQTQPFAEYEIANLQIMVMNDQYANFVQYFAFLVCFVGVTTITKKLGGNHEQQIIAGIITISIPMAILQSTSTQNDLVVSQWLTCFLLFGIGMIREPDNYFWTFGTGLALGLAWLTKATSLIFALPFCLWFGLELIKKARKYITQGFIIGILVLSINFGFLYRNYMLYSNPLGSSVLLSTTNEIHTPGALASNLIRNIALNFSDQEDPFYQIILSGLGWFHKFTGLGNADLRISYTGYDIFRGINRRGSNHEDYAGNPIHAILILITTVISIIGYRLLKNNRTVLVYGLCLLTGFTLFSFYLKFQVFGSRLLLPLFILWVPIIIITLAKKNRLIINLVVFCIVLYSFRWTLGNPIRGINQDTIYNIQNREQTYFATKPNDYPVYVDISKKLVNSGCKRVGINFGGNGWEYPLWVFLANREWVGRIEHVNTSNPTSTLEDKNFNPCAILSITHNITIKFWNFEETKFGSFYLYTKIK